MYKRDYTVGLVQRHHPSSTHTPPHSEQWTGRSYVTVATVDGGMLGKEVMMVRGRESFSNWREDPVFILGQTNTIMHVEEH